MNNEKYPLYYRIIEDIIKDIEEGKYSYGDKLPSENELADKYSTSRITVRKSLDILKRRGFLTAYPGKGNYIKQPDIKNFKILLSGREPEKVVSAISSESVKASDKIASLFEISNGEKILKICAVLKQNDIVSGCLYIYSPYKKQSPVIEEELNFFASNPDSSTTETINIRAVKANETAHVLGLNEDSPVLLMENILKDKEDNSILVYREMYLNPSYFQLIGE